MDGSELARQVVEIVAPALPALRSALDGAAREVTVKAGEAGRDIAKFLWDTLWPRLKDKPGAHEAIEDVARAPSDDMARNALGYHLRKVFETDAGLAREITALLGGSGNANACGERAVAIVGSVSGAIIITGDGHTAKGKE